MFPNYVRSLRILALFMSLKVVDSVCPQKTFHSAKVHVCGGANRRCLNELIVSDCIGPESVFPDTISVRLNSNTSYWRRGAFQDLPELTHVSAVTTNLNRINPGAFLNLPKLTTVELTFNNIEEVLWGVFSDTSIEELDLSWNLISSVEEAAFSNMPNLKILNLQRNKLNELWQSWFENSRNLTTLILSYNELTRIVPFMFEIFHDLSFLDLSFNKIKTIEAHALNNIKHLKRLDLTSNELSWLKPNIFNSPITIDLLRLPLNRLSFLSTTFLKNGNVRSLALHPNPWQCPCLNSLSVWMYNNNVTLVSPSEDHRIKYDSSLPDCSINPKSREKCVVGYTDAFLLAQAAFFREVNYSASVWETPTTGRPNFHVLQTAAPSDGDLSPLLK